MVAVVSVRLVIVIVNCRSNFLIICLGDWIGVIMDMLAGKYFMIYASFS